MCLLTIAVGISMLGPLWLQEVDEGSQLPVVEILDLRYPTVFRLLDVRNGIRDIRHPSRKSIFAE